MAEPTQGPPGTPASAAGDELSIPKHRFDEVNNRLRQLEDDQRIKDRLYLEREQQWRTAQRQPTADITPEESGLDPQVHQAAVKIAAKIAERIVEEKTQVFQQQIGILAGRTEKAELLAGKGADKAKYLPEIQTRQREHYNATGSFLPAEIALEMIMSKEKDERIRRLEAQIAGGQPAATGTQAPAASASTAPATTGAATGGVPSAAGTRQMPGGGNAGGGPAPSASFSNLSIAEMEARLQAQFEEGTTL